MPSGDQFVALRVRLAVVATLALSATGGGCGKKASAPAALGDIRAVIPVEARGGASVRAVTISEAPPSERAQISGLDDRGRTVWSVRVPRGHASWFERPGPAALIASSGRVFVALQTQPRTLVAFDFATGAEAYRVNDAFPGKHLGVHLAGEVAGDLIAVGRRADDTSAVRLSSTNGRVIWRTELGIGNQPSWSRIVGDQLVVVSLANLDVVALDSGQRTKVNAIEAFFDGSRILAYDLENHGALSEYDRAGHKLNPIKLGGQEVLSRGGRLIALRGGRLVSAKEPPDGWGLATRVVAMPYREGATGYDEPLPDGFGVAYVPGWQEYDSRWRVAGDESHRYMLLELTKIEDVDGGRSSRLAIVDLDSGQTRWTSATYPAHESVVDSSIFYADGYYVALVSVPVGGESRRELLVLDARTGVFVGAVGIVRGSDPAGAASYLGSPNPWSVRDGVLYDHSADSAWALDLATLSLVMHPAQIRAELVTQQVAASLGPLPLK